MDLTFVDEDDLPLSSIRVIHRLSDNEEPSDIDSSASDDSEEEIDDENEAEQDDVGQNYENLRWKSTIQPQTDSQFNEDVGMTTDMPNNSTCKEFFELFFNDEVYELMLNETKRFQRQKCDGQDNSLADLHDLTRSELKAWLGLTLAMGLVKKSSLKSYWSTDHITKVPLFGNTMSRNRYLKILKFLHFVNNENAPNPDDPMKDKLWKIRPFLNTLLPRFTEVYKPSRNLSIDETLIKFKGRVQFRQFLPLKRSRFGIKGLVVAESKTGYVLNTVIYTGKEGAEASKNLALRVVLNLVEPYTNKGYRLYVDNWYTSVPLFLELEKKGILACGTVRANHKYLPKDIVDKNVPLVKGMKRGDTLFRQTGNLICATWKDKRHVHVLSTLSEATEIGEVERKVKTGGHWEKKKFGQPSLIKLYDASMGSVDLSDQRIATCSRLMKGTVWYYKIFFHLLEVAVLNSHILYQNAGHPNINLIKFKEILVNELIDGNCFRKDTNTIPAVPSTIRFNHQHFHHPVQTTSHRNCKVHIQRVETSYECGVCHVRMCPAPCFHRYHTMQEYLFDDPSKTGKKRLKDTQGRPRTGPGRPPMRRSR